GFELVIGTQFVTGTTRADLDAERERQRRLMAFLCSTPAYRPTLALYGWEELAGPLRAAIRAERWDDLHGLLNDEVLDTLVPAATYAELPAVIRDRFGHLGQGVLLPVPGDPAADPALAEAVAALRDVP